MSQKLDAYRKKRDFRRTPEPDDRTGGVRLSSHRRYVVQKHDATRLHYDLRLEIDGVFHSWAVTRGPSLDPAVKRLAVEVEDHPLAYGDFEGTIPKGEYGGGTVMIWDRGFWEPEGDQDPERALREGELKFALAGEKLTGSWALVRLEPRSGETRHNWLLIKHRDRWASPGRDTLLANDRSAASGRTMEAIATGTGQAPTPFMLSRPRFNADAEWHSEAEARATSSTLNKIAAMPKLSHPDRVLWPDDGFTKRDLAGYLASIAAWMLPHVQGRPCSFLRAPRGIGEQTFFQRHPMRGQPESIRAVEVKPGDEPYMQLDTVQAILDIAQISVIELHPWNSAPDAPQVPGRLVFDLDPGPGVAFDDVVDAARLVESKLETLGLIAFCKTTGGKGLHVVTPLERDDGSTWDQAKLFARTVAASIADESPDRFVTSMAKRVRRGRIFIDYLRNDETATAVAPLSPRARAGATVSMPLTWGQVRKGLDPKRFTIRTAAAALEKSGAWGDYGSGARRLLPAIQKLIDGSK
jgi:bifunctional non-homologous end joining protein LigD